MPICCRGCSRELSLCEDIAADEAIRSSVTAEIARHGWASSLPTSVVAENGIVHLWGYVDSASAKDAYRIAAENVRGVKRVDNHMNVVPPEVRFGI